MDHTELAETESGPVFIRRPILGLAIAFVLGTLLGLACEPLGPAAIRIAIGTLLIATILSALSGMRRRGSEAFAFQSSFCGACLYVSILSLGCANAALRGAPHEPESLSAAVLQAENVELEGWINGYPQSMDSSFAHLNSWSVPFRIERTRVKRRKWEPTQRDVRVFWNERVGSRKPRYGDTWRLKGIRGVDLQPDAKFRRPVASVSVYGRQTRYVSKGQGSRIKAWQYEARSRAAAHLRIGIEDFPVECNIFQALLLGYRSRLPREIKEMGAATGTMHIFAVSGLHVGLIAGLLIWALSALRVSRVHWIYLLAPLLIIYTLLTGARPSAIRACIMAIIYFLAPAIGRRSDGASALGLAAILILAWDPRQLQDLGFIYSFVVVIGLITLYPVFWDFLRPLWRDDPMRAELEWWRRCILACGKYLAGLFAVSCAAWLTSMPLTAYFFGRFTPIALLGNLVVIPLAFMIVLSGCLSFVLGAVLEVFAEIFNHAALAAIRMFMVSIGGLSGIPLASMEVSRPSMALVITWYVIVSCGAFLLWKRKLGKRMDRRKRG